VIGRRSRQPASFEDALLAVLGATTVLPPDGAGFWVYGLRNAAGETFYVGQSGSLLTRLGYWRKVYLDTLVSVWLVQVNSERSMTVTEDFLIDRLQPRMNVHGMADEEKRVQARIAHRAERTRAAHRALAAAGLPLGVPTGTGRAPLPGTPRLPGTGRGR
jgi:hypothetical protein